MNGDKPSTSEIFKLPRESRGYISSYELAPEESDIPTFPSYQESESQSVQSVPISSLVRPAHGTISTHTESHAKNYGPPVWVVRRTFTADYSGISDITVDLSL